LNESLEEDVDVNVHLPIHNNGKICGHCFEQYVRATDLLNKFRDCANNSVNLLSSNTWRVGDAIDSLIEESTPKKPKLCGPKSLDIPVMVSSHKRYIIVSA